MPLSRFSCAFHFQFTTTSLFSVESLSLFIKGYMDGPLTKVSSATCMFTHAMTGIHVAMRKRLVATVR